MKRKTFIIFTILIPIMLYATEPPALRTVTDMAGRQITIPDTVDRIVCLGRGALRLVTYLNAADRVVGVEFPEKKKAPDTRPYLLAFPFLSEKPYIGYAAQGDPELIMGVGPRVIIYADPAPQAMEVLQAKTGIPVLCIKPGDLGENRDSFFSSLDLLAQVLDKQPRCDSLKTGINALITETTEIASSVPDTVSVYIGGLIFKGRHGLCSTQAQYTPFQLLDLHNVAGDLTGNHNNPVQINPEQLLLWDPDLIFIDKACANMVSKDLTQFPFLREFQYYEIYPNRQYGENFETTLVNTFYIANQVTDMDFKEFVSRADQIYNLFFNNMNVWPKIRDMYGLPGKYMNAEK